MKTDPAKLAKLREKEGHVLDAIFFLHKRIKEMIRNQGEAP
jgi:hypothetical protein